MRANKVWGVSEAVEATPGSAMVFNRHHPPHIEEEAGQLNAAGFVSIDGFNGHFCHPETVS